MKNIAILSNEKSCQPSVKAISNQISCLHLFVGMRLFNYLQTCKEDLTNGFKIKTSLNWHNGYPAEKKLQNLQPWLCLHFRPDPHFSTRCETGANNIDMKTPSKNRRLLLKSHQTNLIFYVLW